jgi:lysophospholipase L1-like esterase
MKTVRAFLTIMVICLLIPLCTSAATSSIYENAINNSFIPKGSLNQAKTSIASGILRVAFIGDSITEGIDQTSPDDNYVNKVQKELTERLPGVNVVVQNFSIAGTGIRSATDITFLCSGTDPLNPTNNTFNRSWCVPNQPWLVPVRAFNPDLVVIAFGMNDIDAGENSTYTYLKALTDTIKTWATVPSIVLVTNMQTTLNASLYMNIPQEEVARIARTTREYAKENGFALADANQLFRILRDGIDDVNRIGSMETNWENYYTNWTGSTDVYSTVYNQLVPNPGVVGRFVSRSRDFYNGAIEFDVNPPAEGIDNNVWINYRESTLGRYSMLVAPGNSGNAAVYLFTNDSTSAISGIQGLTIPTGKFSHIRIEVNETTHKVYLNYGLVLEYKAYKKMHTGGISMGGSGILPTYANLRITYMDPIKTDPVYTEDELLGKYNSLESGNGMNHPSGLGHAEVYFPAFYGIIRELTR